MDENNYELSEGTEGLNQAIKLLEEGEDELTFQEDRTGQIYGELMELWKGDTPLLQKMQEQEQQLHEISRKRTAEIEEQKIKLKLEVQKAENEEYKDKKEAKEWD